MREPASSRAVNGDRYITVKEAAAIYRCTTEYIARLCRSGRLRGYLEDRNWHVHEADLLALAQAQGRARTHKARHLSKERKAEYGAHRERNEVYTALFEAMAVLPRQKHMPKAVRPKLGRKGRELQNKVLALAVASLVVVGNFTLITGQGTSMALIGKEAAAAAAVVSGAYESLINEARALFSAKKEK